MSKAAVSTILSFVWYIRDSDQYLRPLIFCLAICLACSIVSNSAFAQQLHFSEQANNLGVKHQYDAAGVYGGAATFYDFNMDGWDDITLATGTGDSIFFYKNIGGSFQKLPSFIDFLGEAKSVLWVDYDNDGDKDLYISSYLHTNRLYNNDGNMTFSDVTFASELPLDSFPSFGAVWADYDNDGWLDLYFTNRSAYGSWTYTNYLFKNNQNGTFIDKTAVSGVGDGIRSPLCAGFLDFNRDGYQDLYIAEEMNGHANSLYQNNGDGTFLDVSVSTGANIDIEAMCVAVGDYNSDSYQDIYVTNRVTGNKLLENKAGSNFKEVASAAGVEMNSVGWSSYFLDADNDGYEDLYVSGSCPGTAVLSSVFYYNNGDNSFSAFAGIGMEKDTMRSYSNAIGDINNDGYPDILVMNQAPDSSQLWLNSGGTNNWLKIRLEGTVSNRDGIGAFVDIYAGNQHYVRSTHCGLGFLGQGTSSIFVGLGSDSIIDSLRISWPSGIEDKYVQINTNQSVYLIEGAVACANPLVVTSSKKNVSCHSLNNGEARVIASGGSAPYSYLWNTVPESSTDLITGLSGNIYEVQIVDANNCQLNTEVNLFEPSELFVSAITNFPNPGDVNLLVSGGVAPYSYYWSTAATTEDLSAMPPGFYFVQVTDNNGCAKVYVVQL